MVDKLRLEVMLAAVDKVTGPLKAITTGSKTTAQALGQTEAALKKLHAQQKALSKFEGERDKLDYARSALDQAKGMNASKAVVKQLTAEYEKQLTVVKKLQTDMATRGWADARVDQQQLASSIQSTNAQIDAQRRKLELQQQTEQRLATLREKHSQAMVKLGMWGATGAGLMMAGAKARAPLQATVNAFMPAEDSENQLNASMMDSSGAVPKEFGQILELATRLGDKLPGTTADFIDMMTMLRRQGMSAQTVLGGLGEASAYLGVQLKMPATGAAEFGAKMQDATQTTEKDMMGLMDMIQRSYYLGVDPTNMLQGFTKTAAVMPLLGKKGLEASNMIAPMLVMMDQAGMKGEAAGNAIRKVVQMSMNAGKLEKANAMLKGTGVQLEFFDKAGKFAGFDNLFAQLQKLKGVESDVDRIAVIAKLFGDDAETHQVLGTLMEKGADGYREVVAKMQAQADLRKRVDSSLETLSAKAEAAQGSFTNMLKELGAAIAPELKTLLGWLGNMANAAGEWARENPRLTKTLMLTAAAVAALLSASGALVIGIVAVLGPLHMARFLMSRWLLGMVAAKAASMGAAVAIGGRLVGALRLAGTAAATMGRAFLFTPVGLAIAAIAVAALMVYKYWQPLAAFFKGMWAGFSAGAAPVANAIGAALAQLQPVLDWLAGALGTAWNWFTRLLEPMQATQQQLQGVSAMGQLLGQVLGGLVMRFVNLPGAFYVLGRDIIMGFVGGIQALWGWLQQTVAGGFSGLMQFIGAEVLRGALYVTSLTTRFFEAGAAIVQGMANGITSRITAVRDAISTAAGDAVDWFKQKLGIHSPSRVFMQLGGYVGEGAALGIQNGAGMVRAAALGMAAAAVVPMPASAMQSDLALLRANTLATAGAMVPMAVQAMQAPVPQAMPMQPIPLAMPTAPAAGAGGAGAMGGSTYQITINPAPGMDAQAIARAVAAELDRRESASRSRRYSRLSDID